MVVALVPSLSRSLAERFNVFRVMHHGTHEKQLSNVFAWLLRNDGTHGLGDAFQRLFVEQVNRDLPERQGASTGVRVRRSRGEQPKLQPTCRTVRKNSQVRVPRSLRDLRRTPSSTSAPRICRPLSWRALPPGVGRSADQATGFGEQRQCDGQRHPVPVAARRTAQFLPSRGRVRSAGSMWTARPPAARGRSDSPRSVPCAAPGTMGRTPSPCTDAHHCHSSRHRGQSVAAKQLQ